MRASADARLPVGSVRVEVPASSANLGSGFDALAVALSLHDTVEVEIVDGPPGSARVTVEGQGAGRVATDERHLVVRAVHRALADLGHPAPALGLFCRNAVPHSRGLGSSAAALVAGFAAGYALAGLDPTAQPAAARVLQGAAAWEGHADNAAASLYGGAVVAWQQDGRFDAVRMPVHPDVHPVALVPDSESATHTTRGLLPEQVPHADAAFAAGRTALAVHALTRDPSRLLAATEDRLHQAYRESAWPDTYALVQRLRAAGVPAAVSGAGPTALALTSGGALPGEVPVVGFRVLPLPVDDAGVRVLA
ncbi:homoserine kinase [Saccharopolyspora sp. CA-218241]|uniref:homoserine kinase n=1 Tax=Saccharopolyspora sp. CA-218241 TaxID=3240027 RepID=UPI003D990E8B